MSLLAWPSPPDANCPFVPCTPARRPARRRAREPRDLARRRLRARARRDTLGHAALDAVLPGRGWPVSALTEIVLTREGIGKSASRCPRSRGCRPRAATSSGLRRRMCRTRRRCRRPGSTSHGSSSSTARPQCRRSAVGVQQALRAPECGAAFAWFDLSDDRVLRRLAVAEGRTWGVLWRRPILVDVACDLTHDRCRALWLQCTDRAVVLAGSVIDDVALIDVAGAGEFCATRTNIDAARSPIEDEVGWAEGAILALRLVPRRKRCLSERCPSRTLQLLTFESAGNLLPAVG